MKLDKFSPGSVVKAERERQQEKGKKKKKDAKVPDKVI
tara:strand:+ start:744 stop:857 length:114 start_codon:yes stop_codon:yes gene_type:complete